MGLRDHLLEKYGEDAEFMLMEGFDHCVFGVAERFGQQPIICYDWNAVITTLVERDGMEFDDAVEFWSVNQLGAWVGEGTPCFIHFISVAGGDHGKAH